MSGTMEILIREMTIEDYEAVYHLWTEIRGFGIRSIFMTNQLVLPFVEEKTRNSLVVNSVHQRFRRQLPLAI